MLTKSIQVVEVQSRKDWNAFYALPEEIYADFPHMSPIPRFEVQRLLDTKNNPFFDDYTLYALVCYKYDTVAGRLTVHIPNDLNKTKTATFGFLETINDIDTCRALIDCALSLSRKHGVDRLEGPYNPSVRSISGVQISGYDSETMYYEACSRSYYPYLLECCGMKPLEYGFTWLCQEMQRFREGSHDIPVDEKYRIWFPKRSELPEAFIDFRDVISTSFQSSWRDQPVSPSADFYSALSLMDGFTDGTIAIVYHGSIPVGAIICALDLVPLARRYAALPKLLRQYQIQRNLHSVKRLVFYAMAMKEEYRNSPAGYLLAHSFQHIASRFDSVSSTWITAGNHASERIARRFGLSPWKKFAIYGTKL